MKETAIPELNNMVQDCTPVAQNPHPVLLDVITGIGVLGAETTRFKRAVWRRSSNLSTSSITGRTVLTKALDYQYYHHQPRTLY
jgi:hypothetical protein